MSGKKIKTMEDFAKSIGLSRPTVSKYFDDPAKLRTSSRLKIEAALAKSDFRPSLLAANLKRQNSKIIGVIVPDRLDPFYMALTNQLEEHAAQAGYLVFALNSDGNPEREVEAIRTFASLNVSGAAIAPLGPASNAKLIRKLGREFPLVFMDSRLDFRGPFVGTDNEKSMSVIVRYLVRTGTAPSYFDMPAVNANAQERRNAYVAAMKKLGEAPIFEPVEPSEKWDFEGFAFENASKILSGPGFASDTVLCANDRIAFGVLAAAHAQGLNVGIDKACDLRIAGHDNHPLSKYCFPPLTTVAQDYTSIGTAAMELLLQQMHIGADAQGKNQQDQLLFSAELKMRESA